ncbi:lipid IV(A) 3-deoxy-D-manno-octulosonic acid transferase [Candidatus Parabeggiatoa sp. HSG14]|uniref:lipid IV(A) 3-deoxy-D-manno-octulosonic acid transferase n=1 Tax=Candidatus Parabeggiatoa sp. HSG14 TaxID=3055593 RepID=UPI0025A830D1|nr:lipid IV(A) 3-deoxy-D-manno-octulosonic acid transferase [Thiotrichales bacterium HSG14]
MRLLYTFLFYLLIPLILLRLLWRGVRARSYWQRWPERFGFIPTSLIPQSVWIHAVSMGEVQAAVSLIQVLRTRFPDQILVTTMTPTGSQRVREVFGDSVQHVYLPYDLPDAMTRFLNRVQPQLLILMETELWPNLLYACQARAIPVVLANARLSAKSATRYQYIGGLLRQMLAGVEVAAQTKIDARRFIELGVPPSKVHFTGSIKFDTRLPANFSDKANKLRHQWGKNRAVWVAASTHEGEEEAVLNAFCELKKEFTNLLLMLVPRHPERFNRVATLCKKYGFIVARRSKGSLSSQTEIYLGDTMGELPLLYAACDIAYVGGSLVPIGGHNLLEPAAVGLPVIMGHHVFECEEICRQLLKVGAAQQINDATQLANIVKIYLNDKILTKQTGEKGRLFVEQNRGALERLLAIIDEI